MSKYGAHTAQEYEYLKQQLARVQKLRAETKAKINEMQIDSEVERRVAQRLAGKSCYTPSYSAPATCSSSPEYKESMELVENLSKGYPATAMATFKKYLSFYMGAGKCYLPEILKGAIDGNDLEFIEFLIKEASKLNNNALLKTYESFVKLKGVDGKDPSDYAASLYNYRISSRLKEVEKANESKFRF